MKRIAYLSAIAMMIFASCTKEDFGVKGADPQTNPQEEAVTVPAGVEVTAAEVINLAEVTGEYVTVATCTPVQIEGAEYVYNLTIEGVEVNVEENMMVAVTDIKRIVEDKYGKRPVERAMAAVVKASAMLDGQAFNIGSAEFEIKVIPAAPFIDEAYYLVGDMCGWDAATAVLFKHSGKDVYEDPVFSLVIDVPDTDGNGGDYWKIIPKTNYDGDFWGAGVLGTAVDGDTATEGKLVTEAPQAGKIETTGLHKISINMMDYTYSIMPVDFVEYIYIPGNHQRWDPATAQKLWSPAFDGIYTGFCAMNGDFKFTKQPAWGEEYNYESFSSYSDGISQGDGTNINIAEGFYHLTVDVGIGSVEAVSVKWGIIGDATENGWDSDQDMTWDADGKCWTATITLTDGTMKFRANDAWDINLGGNIDNLTAGGNDIAVTAGTYVVKLYCERTEAQPQLYCTMTRQ